MVGVFEGTAMEQFVEMFDQHPLVRAVELRVFKLKGHVKPEDEE